MVDLRVLDVYNQFCTIPIQFCSSVRRPMVKGRHALFIDVLAAATRCDGASGREFC